MGQKKIVIAEDQTIVRQGLTALLNLNDEYKVVGEAENGIEAIKKVAVHLPDLLLLDLSMPKMNGISVIKDIKKQFPETKILVLTSYKSEEYILETFKSGAEGYCLKNATHEELLLAIKSILAGQIYISPEVSGNVLEGYLKEKQTVKTDTSWESLTRREKEILKLVGEGHTSKKIADILCISPKTVDKHRANIMNKLNLHSATALTAYAVDKGLVVQ